MCLARLKQNELEIVVDLEAICILYEYYEFNNA